MSKTRREVRRGQGNGLGVKSAHPLIGDDEAVRDLRVLHRRPPQEAQHVKHLLVLREAGEPLARGIVQLNVLAEDGKVGLLGEDLRVVVAEHVDRAA